MKKIIFAALLSLPAFLSAGQYVGLHGGTDYSYKTNDSNAGQKVGYGVGLVYGHDVADQIRAEVEVTYRSGSKRKVYTDSMIDSLESVKYESKHSWSYMINLIYDVNQLATYNLTPFAGVGIGYGNNVTELKVKYDSHIDSEKRRDSDFAWQVVAGVSYPITDSVKSRVQYCYHRGEQHSISHSATAAIVKEF